MSQPSETSRYLVGCEAGELIFSRGEAGEDMYIVHEGAVEIDRDGEPVARLEKGDFFGEMSLLEELPRVASARAVTDAKLIRIDSAAFDKLLRREPEIAIRIMRKLSRRLREVDARLQALGDVPKPVVEPLDEPPVARHGLKHLETDIRFKVSRRGETTIGRGDPVTGLEPDIDLTPVDPDRSSSRKHAKLLVRDGAFFVVEEIGTTNGTFVNGARLEAGHPLRVSAGDRLRFGLVELVLADESRSE